MEISCACVPLMVSCSGFGLLRLFVTLRSGFGLPMHAQLLRLFVTHIWRKKEVCVGQRCLSGDSHLNIE